MEKRCWNIRKIKKTGQGLPEELGKYIWLAKAGTSQEAPASKSGSSSQIVYLDRVTAGPIDLREKFDKYGEYIEYERDEPGIKFWEKCRR